MVTNMAKLAVLCLFLLATTQCRAQEIDDWTKKCNKCKCVWSSGKKTANCSDLNLNSIPSDLSTQIREMDFSLNPIYGLGVKIFFNNHIKNVHRLKFQNCSLESIDKTAFAGLQLLIELDLSRNNLEKIHKETFRENEKMRILNLSFNKLTELESDLFYNMTFLQRIILNDNQIKWMGQTVFGKLPALQYINLGNNKLKTVVNDFTKDLGKLNSLNIEGNPWICDCNLEQFRRKTLRENWITTPTICSEPDKMKGILWSSSEVFACAPTIIEPQGMSSVEVTTTNVTLTCKVSGQPLPDVDWLMNGRKIDTRQNIQKYVLSNNTEGNFTWKNLTIINVAYRDRGEYKCQAKNPGGTVHHNLTVIVSSVLTHTAGFSNGIMKPIEGYIPVIIGVLLALLFLFIIISFLMCRCRRSSPRNGADRKGGDNESSSEYINLHGQPDLEKSLITDVNPVVKPPRFAMPTPMSMSSGGTEVSDAKRNLLDSDSMYIGDDESRSLDFDIQSRKMDMLDMRHPYPPDLLPPFPHRASQVSPAGSSASTVADTSRLPALHGPQSPLHSPFYDHIYRTLPHSRSHSPFTPISAPFVPRQGYVTIPRRPRQQSWSSEPPEVAEPLYDNLGRRTSAMGSSVNRLALSPTSCVPIAENDSPPTVSATLPRNLNQKLSPSRTNWAKANAEAFQTPDRRNSLSVFPSNDQKPSKIPPRPPPKPKKKISTGPLFEDEGEDGTEV